MTTSRFKPSTLAALISLFSTASIANAACEKDFSGTFANQKGDKFRIEQPSCNFAIVSDLKNGKTFRLATDGSEGSLGETPMDPTLYFLKDYHWDQHQVTSTFSRQSLPGLKTFSAREVFYRSEWKDSSIHFYLWNDLKWKKNLSQSNLVLSARAKAVRNLNSVTIQVCDAVVDANANASFVERTIASGGNRILDLVKAAKDGCFYREVLTQVSDSNNLSF